MNALHERVGRKNMTYLRTTSQKGYHFLSKLSERMTCKVSIRCYALRDDSSEGTRITFYRLKRDIYDRYLWPLCHEFEYLALKRRLNFGVKKRRPHDYTLTIPRSDLVCPIYPQDYLHRIVRRLGNSSFVSTTF